MIRVAHLSKVYGRGAAGRGPALWPRRAKAASPPQPIAGGTEPYEGSALIDVSFDVAKGEVVGLLGPNGAGKTTMMRILTCFLAPTRGSAELAGCSISARDTRPLRRAVGYLPEAVPLYPEMRVIEYLEMRAALKGIPGAERRRAIDAAMEPCGLGDRRRQIIATLSGGYRQRVGLADALLARPPVLILDEPTAGLDPNQIREVRAVIRALAGERTVLLSTHILPEVEAVASRVVILQAGRVVAAQTPAELRARMAGRRRVVVEVAPDEMARAERVLGAAPGIASSERLDGPGGRLALTIAGAGDSAEAEAREAIFRAAAAAGLALRGLAAESLSLEEIFARITTSEDQDKNKERTS